VIADERESVRAIAERLLAGAAALEDQHSRWLSALRAQELIRTAPYYGTEPEAEDLDTLRLYVEAQEAAGDPVDPDYLEDSDPVWQWLESSLSVVSVIHRTLGGEEDRWGWQILLCAGGPSAGLELRTDGWARVWASWWSPQEEAVGRLDWLAGYLEELGL
jgi:hypothetical protein